MARARSAGLTEHGFGAWLTASQAIGYAELAAHLDGRLALDEAMEPTVKRTKELARRQHGVVPSRPTHPVVRGGGGRRASRSSTTSRAYLEAA